MAYTGHVTVRKVHGRRRWGVVVTALALLALSTAARVEAQFVRGFLNAKRATPHDFDGRFSFCRVAFASDFRGDGANWSVDYPRADINLSIRLSELTKTTISKLPSGAPNNLLIRLTDPELFDCPFIMMTEVGAAAITPEEAKQLRLYLEKGGFLWADDFWGTYAWEWWEAQLRTALPADEFPIVDLPPDHPLFHALFDVPRTPQIPSISFWASTEGHTSERGADSATVHTRAALDRRGRIIVLMTHNTDFGDSFEREADDPQYFYQMSVPGYAFGINALVYAMSH